MCRTNNCELGPNKVMISNSFIMHEHFVFGAMSVLLLVACNSNKYWLDINQQLCSEKIGKLEPRGKLEQLNDICFFDHFRCGTANEVG